MGEHLPCTQGVKGSSPLFSTADDALGARCRDIEEIIDILDRRVEEESKVKQHRASAVSLYGDRQIERNEKRADGGCLRLSEAKKGVISCEKPRGSANAK